MRFHGITGFSFFAVYGRSFTNVSNFPVVKLSKISLYVIFITKERNNAALLNGDRIAGSFIGIYGSIINLNLRSFSKVIIGSTFALPEGDFFLALHGDKIGMIYVAFKIEL